MGKGGTGNCLLVRACLLGAGRLSVSYNLGLC